MPFVRLIQTAMIITAMSIAVVLSSTDQPIMSAGKEQVSVIPLKHVKVEGFLIAQLIISIHMDIHARQVYSVMVRRSAMVLGLA